MVIDPGVRSLIERYRPSLFVLASQLVAATQNAAAKFIETRLEPVHPFQILLVRMLITGLACTWYLWHIGSSGSNTWFGTPDVRGLVLLRALGGVCGATGFFFSMIYLSLSEATALNFLGPLGSLILTRYLSFATVQWTDCLGAVGALVGVVLIAQPEDIFGTTNAECDGSEKINGHLNGFAFGVLGLCGGIVALTSIRRIGTRAHPLTSVNMFAWSLVIVSGLALMVVPRIVWPRSPFVWVCLIYIGMCAFAMDYLLTFGLSSDSTSAATLMIYSQIVWALVLDSALFQAKINSWALLGAATVIGSLSLITVTGEGRKSASVVYTELRQEEHECTERLGLEELHAEQMSPLMEIDTEAQCDCPKV